MKFKECPLAWTAILGCFTLLTLPLCLAHGKEAEQQIERNLKDGPPRANVLVSHDQIISVEDEESVRRIRETWTPWSKNVENDPCCGNTQIRTPPQDKVLAYPVPPPSPDPYQENIDKIFGTPPPVYGKEVTCPPLLNGLIAHPYDCSKYLQCANGHTVIHTCSTGTVFNPVLSNCDWAANVRGCEGTVGKTYTNPQPSHIVGSHEPLKQLPGNEKQIKKISCPQDYSGLLPHPDTCKKFLQCANGITYIMDCGPGTAFHPKLQICDWPYKVPGCDKETEDSGNNNWHDPNEDNREAETKTTAYPWEHLIDVRFGDDSKSEKPQIPGEHRQGRVHYNNKNIDNPNYRQENSDNDHAFDTEEDFSDEWGDIQRRNQSRFQTEGVYTPTVSHAPGGSRKQKEFNTDQRWESEESESHTQFTHNSSPKPKTSVIRNKNQWSPVPDNKKLDHGYHARNPDQNSTSSTATDDSHHHHFHHYHHHHHYHHTNPSDWQEHPHPHSHHHDHHAGSDEVNRNEPKFPDSEYSETQNVYVQNFSYPEVSRSQKPPPPFNFDEVHWTRHPVQPDSNIQDQKTEKEINYKPNYRHPVYPSDQGPNIGIRNDKKYIPFEKPYDSTQNPTTTNVFDQANWQDRTAASKVGKDTNNYYYPNGIYVIINGTRGHLITKDLDITPSYSKINDQNRNRSSSSTEIPSEVTTSYFGKHSIPPPTTTETITTRRRPHTVWRPGLFPTSYNSTGEYPDSQVRGSKHFEDNSEERNRGFIYHQNVDGDFTKNTPKSNGQRIISIIATTPNPRFSDSDSDEYKVDVLDDNKRWRTQTSSNNKTASNVDTSVVMKINKDVELDLLDIRVDQEIEEEPQFPVYYIPQVHSLEKSSLKLGHMTPSSGQIFRLRGGRNPREGYLEAQGIQPGWGVVCDTKEWTLDEAHIVCKQLGYARGARNIWRGREPTKYDSKVPSWIAANNVECSGNEIKFQTCKFDHEQKCRVDKDAVGIRCFPNPTRFCHEDEIAHRGLCYHLADSNKRLTHAEALEYCKERQSTLLNILNQDENNFISEWLIQEHPEIESVMTSGMGFSTFGRTVWLWEDFHQAPFKFNKWWRGWLSDKQGTRLAGSRPICITLTKKFACHDRPDDICFSDYFFWEAEDCASSAKGHASICERPFSDEKSKLSEKCKPTEFECRPGECIPSGAVCNGEEDCSNGADEMSCETPLHFYKKYPNYRLDASEVSRWTNTTLDMCASKCKETTSFICRSFNHKARGNICVLSTDNIGRSGALKGSAEYDYYELSDRSIDCEEMFTCSNNKCIPRTMVCNGKNDCNDRSDEIICSDKKVDYAIRLVGSNVANEGRVEVKVFGTWGQVCNNDFDLNDAEVICRELNFPGAAGIRPVALYGKPSDPNNFAVDRLQCRGSEMKLRECEFGGWRVHDCEPSQAIAITCNDLCAKHEWKCGNESVCIPIQFLCDSYNDCPNGEDETYEQCEKMPFEVRLVNGSTALEGRVEVQHHGTWGTICDDDINSGVADVICRELGYEGPTAIYGRAHFGQGVGPVWLDRVRCKGNEKELRRCSYNMSGVNNCDHSEDVGVICSYSKKQAADLLKKILPSECGKQLHRQSMYANQRSKRVVQGSEAVPGAFPWQATIRLRGANDTNNHHCGAIIISPKYLLTAAHCVHHKGNFHIRTGDYNTMKVEESEVDAEILRSYVHEDFQPNSDDNDIALIVLEGKGLYQDHIMPICLPDRNVEYTPGLNCIISGFGRTVYGGENSPTLQSAIVPLVDQSRCKAIHDDHRDVKKGMVCAGYLEGGADTCKGDSGGPLACAINDTGTYTLFGMTSWGMQCAESKPGVYVRIAYYRPWIEKMILRAHIDSLQ